MNAALRAAAPFLLCAPPALAQPFAIQWSTVSAGGRTVPSTGGSFGVAGTIGQTAAGSMSGGVYTLSGGFWAAATPGDCYANCDNSTTPPTLNVADFTCFLQEFAAGCP